MLAQEMLLMTPVTILRTPHARGAFNGGMRTGWLRRAGQMRESRKPTTHLGGLPACSTNGSK